MNQVVILNGPSCLDFADLRLNALRIPEVVVRIRRAQQVWDYAGLPSFEWVNFLASDDNVFLNSIRYKAVAAAIIQLGLFDRYVKKHGRPDFLMGDLKEDSPINVAAGFVSFEDYLLSSKAFQSTQHLELAPAGDLPVLSGMSLAEFGVLSRTDEDESLLEEADKLSDTYRVLKSDKSDIKSLLSTLIEELGVRRFVNIGPGSQLVHKGQDALLMSDVQVVESIDIDPMLTWFWPTIQSHHPG